MKALEVRKSELGKVWSNYLATNCQTSNITNVREASAQRKVVIKVLCDLKFLDDAVRTPQGYLKMFN